MYRFYHCQHVLLLAVVLACSTGCCYRNLGPLPADCSWVLEDCACGDGVAACEGFSAGTCPARLRNIQPGPPPVTYQPPMPPKFLPVPTRSVFSPAASTFGQ